MYTEFETVNPWQNPENQDIGNVERIMEYAAGMRMEIIREIGQRISSEIWQKIPIPWQIILKDTLNVGLNWAPGIGDIKMLRAIRSGRESGGRELAESEKVLYALSVSCSAISYALGAYMVYLKLQDSNVNLFKHPGTLVSAGSHFAAEAFQATHTAMRSLSSLKNFADTAGLNSAASMLKVFERISRLYGSNRLTILNLRDDGK